MCVKAESFAPEGESRSSFSDAQGRDMHTAEGREGLVVAGGSHLPLAQL